MTFFPDVLAVGGQPRAGQVLDGKVGPAASGNGPHRCADCRRFSDLNGGRVA